MRQYEALKAAHPDALLLFRVGDFYELFGDDAVAAAPLLDIALTSRDKQNEHAVPLCGVPHHAIAGYLGKLLAAGKAVALAEQMEEPRPGALVRREVVRVLTPGTVLDDDLLPAREHAYLAAVLAEGDEAAVARVDLSTGDFEVAGARGEAAAELAAQELARAEPREILATPQWARPLPPSGVLRPCAPDAFDLDSADRALNAHFGAQETWSTLPPIERRCAGAILRYLEHTLKGRTAALRAPTRYAISEFVGLDETAQRTLELTRGAAGSRHGSLLWAIDETVTAMGGRLLRERLLRPLRSRPALEARYREIAAFLAEPETRAAVRDTLRTIQDVERAIARIAMLACAPRDLVLVARAIEAGAALAKTLLGSTHPDLAGMGRGWEDFGPLTDLLMRALVPVPPPTAREGGVIRDGYDPELDALRAIRRDGKGWIAQLEARERARTGIESLKIRHNQIFGYYIEITKANAGRVPAEYHRRQTLVNAERYVTPELADLEAKVLGAEEKIRALELRLFEDLRAAAARETSRIQAYARRLARLDAASALADAAQRYRWTAPALADEPVLQIREGRHPVVERLLPAQRFIPNDVDMDGADTRVL
ncbi:MAG: DNA mismatch repair protein MutS, partial [Nitrospiria bacterium]